MKNTVLLVVDVQTALVETHPYNEKEVTGNIKHLIDACRAKNIEVIYIRHDGGKGSSLEKNTPGWEIYEAIAPQAGEKIFEKLFNSAFKETGLKQYLDSKKIENIILVGMQTEYCIDATCKVAFESGYRLFMPEMTVTTFGNSYLSGKDLCTFYVENIWKNRFAEIIPVEEMIRAL